MSNFSFLEEKWPILAQLGENAEDYMYVDSNIAIFKAGLFAEKLCNFTSIGGVLQKLGIVVYEGNGRYKRVG